MRHLLQLLLVAVILFVNSCSPEETPRPAPKASFIWSNASEGVIQFSDQSSEADTYAWNFGDGTPISTDKSPKHSFDKNARYTVTLTVTNSTASDRAIKEIEVTSFAAPVPDFTAALGEDGAVIFTNNSINALTYNWDLGNGIKSNLASPSVKYTENKKYTVTLTATGRGGEAKTSKDIEISNVKPVADFTWTESDGQVTFINKSKNSDSYSWDFGNGKTSSETNPTIQYSKVGEYNVKLTAKGRGGKVTKTATIPVSYVVPILTDAQVLTEYLPGVWGAYVDGEGYKFDNYRYEFSKLNNIMKYENYYNQYQYVSSSETIRINYKFSITDKVIYTETSSGKIEKHARFQIISQDEMKLFRIIESSSSYTELSPILLTRTSDVEKPISSVVNSKALLDILKGVWDHGTYSIYNDVSFDFSSGKNFYNYNSTFKEARSIEKQEFKIDVNNVMSYRRWNSDFDPSWKKYKVEIVSETFIKLYTIDANGRVSNQVEYALKKRS